MQIVDKLRSFATNERKERVKKYHKIGDGGYAENDKFLGVYVPDIRSVAKKEYMNIGIEEIDKLIHSTFHEERLLAVIILTYKYESSTVNEREKLANFYLSRTKYINGWDLVDLTAPNIIGKYVYDTKEYSILYRLSKSKLIWDRRISIVSNLYLIKRGYFDLIFDIIKNNLNDNEDLIHKAMGWMLREIGKLDYMAEYNFLRVYYKQLPRVTLRYSIERFDKEEKKRFLKGEI